MKRAILYYIIFIQTYIYIETDFWSFLFFSSISIFYRIIEPKNLFLLFLGLYLASKQLFSIWQLLSHRFFEFCPTFFQDHWNRGLCFVTQLQGSSRISACPQNSEDIDDQNEHHYIRYVENLCSTLNLRHLVTEIKSSLHLQKCTFPINCHYFYITN